MARQELHSTKLPPVAQRTPIKDGTTEYAGDIVTGETIGSVEGSYLADLAMNEEPVTIRLEPSSDKYAATSLPVWVNGKGAECLINGRWVEIGYLPVGVVMVVKRKYLGVIIGAKIDVVTTDIQQMDAERPDNRTARRTSPIQSFSIIHDANPRGAAWAAEQRRRQL